MRCTLRQPGHHPVSTSSQQGRTRLIIVIVLAFLALLAAWGVPKVIDAINHAHSPEIVTTEKDLAAIEQALQLYQKDNGRYPGAEQGLLALIIKPVKAPVPKNWKTGGYIDRLTRDPWGNPYQYRATEDGSEYAVFSFGAAGPDGGDESDTIIRGRH